MKKYFCIFILSVFVFVSGCDLEPETITVNWSGAWENDVHYFGTFTLTMTLEGEYLDKLGGWGTLTGNIVCEKYDGTVLLDSAVSGTWSNEFQELELDISTDNETLIMGFNPYLTAADLGSDTDIIGSFQLYGESGHCYTCGDYYNCPDVQAAMDVVSAYTFGNITYAEQASDQYLYAVSSDGGTNRVSRINIADGTVTDILIVAGMVPYSLACDGSYLWLAGKADPGDTYFSLYKFDLSDLTTVAEDGYPVALSGYGGLDLYSFSISHNGTSLYYHNNDFFFPEVGLINTADGSCSVLIPGSMGSSISRTDSIAAYGSGFYTSYFAAGGVWCEIEEFNFSGVYQDSFCPPLNGGASLALNGSIIYLIQDGKLYTVQL